MDMDIKSSKNTIENATPEATEKASEEKPEAHMPVKPSGKSG
ncbi:hypothetical protein TDIS_0109 [Thermosulfurimonas dismutans]|uniref:Uncharacterized protein n=3 Tax=Thermosulfurimonas dismutans TaxID=999894 RepID=A0A179D727_9BACT|nr:hypothetical protein TDIS_0109 [Thermosulfurimonas dismutans]